MICFNLFRSAPRLVLCAFVTSLYFCFLACTSAWSQEASLADYRIDIGDVLEFDFLDDQETPRQIIVGGGGDVQVPLLGRISVAGLTIDQALERVTLAFVSNKMLVDPKITLTIATYRPIYVLGDVRTPGAFPYQASLTVERAVGIAGGLIAEQSTTESRVIARSRLEGELARLGVEIAREAVWSARLGAQIEGRTALGITDIDEEALRYSSKNNIEHFLAVETKILTAELTAYNSQISILTLNITETAKQLELLERLRQNQQTAIAFTNKELERAEKWRKSGLNTAGDLTEVQRQLNTDEGRLLQILSDISETQRQAAALQQQLAALKDNRNRDSLFQMQERRGQLQQLFANYRASQEQLALATSWTNAMEQSNLQSVITFKIRKRAGSSTGDITATATMAVLPGDVLIVSIAKPNADTLMQVQ